MVTIAARRSQVKFSVARRGSSELGNTARTVTAVPDADAVIPRYVMLGRAGKRKRASARRSFNCGPPILDGCHRGRCRPHYVLVAAGFAMDVPLPTTDVGWLHRHSRKSDLYLFVAYLQVVGGKSKST